MQLTFVDVDPAFLDEYLSVQREITGRQRGGGRGGRGGRGGAAAPAPADRDDAPASANFRIVGRSDAFGNTYRFMFLTPLQNLGALDTRNADPALELLNSRAAKYVTGQQSFAIRYMPDFSKPLADRTAPEMLLIDITRVTPGREQEYMNLMKSDFLPHFEKAEYSHQTGAIAFGGEGGFIHMYYIRNYAKLDEGSPVVRALGVEAAQAATAKFAGLVTSSEHLVARVLPELSFGPWTAAPARP
jgi:hypothetical protein